MKQEIEGVIEGFFGVGVVEQCVVYNLHSTMKVANFFIIHIKSGEHPLLFRRSSERRHLQMQGTLGTS